MFQSSNSGINYNYYMSFFNDMATSFNSKHQFDQSFFNLPSPLEEDDFFHSQNPEFLLHYQQQAALKEINSNSTAESHKIETNSINSKGNEQMGLVMRRRCLKRDRHSKITTAQGPRDRRMRLSLKVAREFFHLQDKLCFDKASKTVEWLLIQSCSAIKELTSTTVHQSACSTSECQVISGIQDEDAIKDTSSTNNSSKRKKARKAALFYPGAKESRVKARARARERTRNKHLAKEPHIFNLYGNQCGEGSLC